MATFALVDDHNIVRQVVKVPDHQQHRGHEFLSQDLGIVGGKWIQTSFNTHDGKHFSSTIKDPRTGNFIPDGGTPIRHTYASIGFHYDPVLDIFYPPKPYPSWVRRANGTGWEPPIPMPTPSIKTTGIDPGWLWSETDQTWYRGTWQGYLHPSRHPIKMAPTPSITPSIGSTPTPTSSNNVIPTPSPSPTISLTPSFGTTPTPTPTPSFTPFSTPTPTTTIGFTPTPSVTFSPTPTPSFPSS